MRVCVDCGQSATPRSPRCRQCAYRRQIARQRLWVAKRRGTAETFRRERPCRDCGAILPAHTTTGRPPILCQSCGDAAAQASRRAWKERNPERVREDRRRSVAAYARRYPERAKAQRDAAMHRKLFGRPREEILGWFGHRCARCGDAKDLHVHHIDGNGIGNPNPNNAPENLTVLCCSCHQRTHRRMERQRRLSHAAA